jgi:hypothetical protein
VNDLLCGFGFLPFVAQIAISTWLLASRDFPFFGGRRIPRAECQVLGATGLAAAIVTFLLWAVEGLLNFVGGTGVEGRSDSPANRAEDRRIFLFFLIPKLVLIFAFVTAFLLVGQYRARFKDRDDDLGRSPRARGGR